MSCLLGLTDAVITSKHKTNWQTNKIGGKPDLYDGADIKVPVCCLCGGNTCLVVQLYCPLAQSQYHRTLYIFACTKSTCWNKNESWTVYKCQRVDSSSLPEKTPSHTGGGDDWGTGADDWGSDAKDWGVQGEDDWGVAADDWGDSQQTTGTTGNVPENATCHADEQSSQPVEKVSEDTPESLAMKLMCIDDVENTEDVDNIKVKDQEHDDEKPSYIIADNVPTLTTEQRKEALQGLQTEMADDATGPESGQELRAYFINVIEESASECEDSVHVTRLLKDYQRREGCNLKDMLEYSGSGGGSGEKYEKTSVLHQDKIFHKFTKKLTHCPQQIIRYEWSGQPLFISSLTSALPVSCGHCGSGLVFELQLTPALVNLLRVPDKHGPAVEFGTVLVFSCSESCWQEGDTYKMGHVMVQPDPDIQLYK